ncbi:MAG: fibronectin type III domain-containing protein [Patescibacteria group bacterium]|jgi:hypothetical protein
MSKEIIKLLIKNSSGRTKVLATVIIVALFFVFVFEGVFLNSPKNVKAAAPAFVQGGGNYNWAQTTLTKVATGVVSGNAIIGSVSWKGVGSTVTSVTDNAPGGSNVYTLLESISDSGRDGGAVSFYALNVVGGDLTITVHFSVATTGWSTVVFHEVSGIATTNAIDASAVSADASTVGPSITTTFDGDYIYGALLEDTPNSSGFANGAASSGFTIRVLRTSDKSYGTEDKIQGAHGLVNAAFTTTAPSYKYFIFTIAFKSADAGLADEEAPSVPQNLSVTPVSTSQINLAWDVSSDNVGVAGYQVFRCAGSSCTPSEQIATSVSITYSDTGLTQSTPYTYSVSAYDAARNISEKSTSSVATTLSPATVVATSCSQTAVQAAIDLASSGDTVVVPAGNCTWYNSDPNGTTVIISGKSINFVGSGIDTTNITLSSQFVLKISSSLSSNVDVAGFTFIGSSTVDNGFVSVGGDNTGSIRIHHNKFLNGYGYHLSVNSNARALIDHNEFDHSTQQNQDIFFQNYGNIIGGFRNPIGWGQGWSSNVLWTVVEDNIFRHPCSSASNASIMDIQSAGKMVFRNNTIYNGYLVTHAACWSANNTGVYAAEIYNNSFVVGDGCSHYALTGLMSGTYLFFNNTLKYYGTGHFDADICSSADATCPHNWQDARTLDTTHGCDSTNNMWMYCNGSQNMWCSGSTDTAWYTCNSTVDNCAAAGKGTCSKKHCSNSWNLCTVDGDCSNGGTCIGYLDNLDDVSGRVCFSGTGAGKLNDATGKIDSDPMYFWNNSLYTCDASGNNCVYSKRIDIDDDDISANTKMNVDFFNNTQKPGYTSYVYPHPLTATSTMGTDLVNIAVGARVFGSGRFYDLATSTGADANLSIILATSSLSVWLDIAISNWTNTGTHHKAWTEGSDNMSDISTVHTIGDLEANTDYDVKVDDVLGANITGDNCTSGVCTSDGSGYITFTYTGGYSDHIFDVEESGAASVVTITFTATSTTATTATITFTTDQSATSTIHYATDTYYNTHSQTYDQASSSDTLNTSHSITLSGLTEYTQYHFYIEATNASGTATSSDYTFTTDDATNPIVTGFDITDATSSSLTIDINTFTGSDVGGSGVVGYLINEISDTPLAGAAGWLSSTWSTYTFLSDGVKTLYAWVKDAYDNISASQNDSITIDSTAPTISAIASSTDTTTATITWTTNENATSSVSYGSTVSYDSASSSNELASTTHTINLSSLDSGSTYHFKIFSTDTYGNTSSSSDNTFYTTGTDSTPPEIDNISSSTTLTTATITFTTNEEATSTIYYGEDDSYGSTSSSNTSTTTHSIIISSLATTTDYHFQIEVADASGNIATSSDYVFTTLTPTTYTVGGTISGLSGTVVIQNNSSDDISTTTSGAFTFSTSLDEGDNYTVTVYSNPTSQTCTITNGSGINISANITNVAITCADNTCATLSHALTYNAYPTCGAASCISGYTLSGSGASAVCVVQSSGGGGGGGGSITVPQVTLASATGGNKQITLNWTNPSVTWYFSGVKILRKQNSAPASSGDTTATVAYTSNNALISSYIDTGLNDNQKYYYSIYSYYSSSYSQPVIVFATTDLNNSEEQASTTEENGNTNEEQTENTNTKQQY